MTATNWIRQFHRWVSLAFVVTIVITSVALAQKEPIVWVSYVPLAPLALLLLTGVWLFVQPYTLRWRKRREA